MKATAVMVVWGESLVRVMGASGTVLNAKTAPLPVADSGELPIEFVAITLA